MINHIPGDEHLSFDGTNSTFHRLAQGRRRSETIESSAVDFHALRRKTDERVAESEAKLRELMGVRRLHAVQPAKQAEALAGNSRPVVKSGKDKMKPGIITALAVLGCLVVLSFVPRAQNSPETKTGTVASTQSKSPVNVDSDASDGWERADSPAKSPIVKVQQH